MKPLMKKDLHDLRAICPKGVQCQLPLANISRWRVGGLADVIIQPANQLELKQLLQWFKHKNLSPLVLGLTSNLLFDDAGVRVPIIQIAPPMNSITLTGVEATVEAGAWMPSLTRQLMQAGLSGLEHTCGIPGTLGGLISMNGGSQRKNIAESLVWVESLNAEGMITRRSATACQFAYRESLFKYNHEVITQAKIKLVASQPSKIRSNMLQLLKDRRKKFPIKQPNCGSVFKSDPQLYDRLGAPGKIIEDSGLKGLSIGGAQVSPLHANFIINQGNATAQNILDLIHSIKQQVYSKTGHLLKTEILYVNCNGHLKAL